MKIWMKSKRWTMLVCLAAMMSLTVACGGDDDSGNNSANNVNNGADAGPDAEADGGDEDTGPEEDAGPDAEPPLEPLSGFNSADDGELDEDAFGWSMFTFNTDGDRFLSLEMSADGGALDTGTFDFEDFTQTEPANTLITAADCGEQGCETFFQAVSGTMEITTFEKTEDGTFEATFTNVELVEVEFTQEGTSVVADGNTWTIASSTVMAIVDPMDVFEANCDIEGFNADADTVTATVDEGSFFVEATKTTDANTETTLALEIYEDYGEPGEVATEAGTYQLDDFNYATCANCLLIYEGCDEQGQCDATYIAGAGTLEVTSTGGVGDQFEATLTGAELAEVTIAQSYDTELVEGGAGWCIAESSWNVTIEAPEAPE